MKRIPILALLGALGPLNLLAGPVACTAKSPQSVASVQASAAAPATTAAAPRLDVPPVRREMRGLWVATVSNIDWPSRKGLATDQQKAELLAILDRAKALGLNAIIFQVRPAGDALYASSLEPWSEYLTGTMGQAPEPYYDPLAFAVEEAHRRGLELHAWFNPFRARYPGAASPVAPTHLSARRPDLVKPYGRQMWMDPGEPEVRAHSLAVITDVVRRYDVDGVHLDDYFYPYKERDASKNAIPFPDDASFQKYQAAGGRLSRDDWRRANINGFVEDLYRSVKREKPWVKVGISPFGIWRPGSPPGIQGLDPYQDLYADSRKWLQNGWVDYFAPQLYWATSRPNQSYAALLDWWASQNVLNRSLWPGNILSHPSAEITRQLSLTRTQAGAGGNIFFSASDLMRNRNGVADALAALYTEPAVIPGAPWLDDTPPIGPAMKMTRRLDSTGATSSTTLEWSAVGPEKPALWVLQTHAGGLWRTVVLPAAQISFDLGGANALGPGDAIALSSVDRCGNQSAPTVMTIEERMERPIVGTGGR